MSSEEPLRQVPDELFRKVSARPERALPDALFGPPPTPPPAARTPETVPAGDRSGAADDVLPEPPTEPPDADDGVKAVVSEDDPEPAAAAVAGSAADGVESSAVPAGSSAESAEPSAGAAGLAAGSVETSGETVDSAETVGSAVEPATAHDGPSAEPEGGSAETAELPDGVGRVRSTASESATTSSVDAEVDRSASVERGEPESPLESIDTGAEPATGGDRAVAEPGVPAGTPVAAASREVSSSAPEQRPVLLVIADSLAYFGPEGGLPADHPRIWPNLVGAELDWDVELVARIGWTCRDGYWALIGDPRVWAAVPRAGAVVFAVGGMDSLPSPLPTALRELIRYVRPPAVRRGVRATYQWLQPKLSKLGRPVALPPKVSVSYLEQSREALAQLRPDLPVVAVLPSVHNCAAYGRVHRGRERAVRALRAWSERTSVPLVDLGEAVRENIFSDAANPDGIHWGWDGHTAVANAMVKTLQEVR
nr:diglucosylglycerate octanoyltransferase [Nocardia cyriacigeorgica]